MRLAKRPAFAALRRDISGKRSHPYESRKGEPPLSVRATRGRLGQRSRGRLHDSAGFATGFLVMASVQNRATKQSIALRGLADGRKSCEWIGCTGKGAAGLSQVWVSTAAAITRVAPAPMTKASVRTTGIPAT